MDQEEREQKGQRPGEAERFRRRLLRGSEKAIAQLIKIMADETVKAEVRVSCASEILNRTYGKGGQALPREEACLIELAGDSRTYAE